MDVATSEKVTREFLKYQHVERLGTDETADIEMGIIYVFPKIDGSNGCVWLSDDQVQCGSRRRHLSSESDNQGFYNHIRSQDNIRDYLLEFPNDRLFGEWLIPHSLKAYRNEAWRQFYVFDVANEREQSHEGDSRLEYIHYETYSKRLEAFGIQYVPPICVINNPHKEQIYGQLEKNVYLLQDGHVGEGIVIKNYDWRNKYNRQTWAKVVTSEFKEKHIKAMGVPVLNGKKQVEMSIVEKYVTKALCDKVKAKIEVEAGWSSKFIPRLLHTVYHDLVTEETWNFIKHFKNPEIDFKNLQKHTYRKVKELMPELF